jgi:hypothetical protein
MIKMNNRLITLTAFMVLLGSCREEENEIPFEAVGDVYYISKLESNQKVTARAFYAYGNKAIVEATVTAPSQEAFELDKSKENAYTVFNEPAGTDFTPDYPVEGTYIFNLKSSDNDKMELSDKLTRLDLEIPEIVNIAFEALDESYDIEWNDVEDAQDYLVELYDSNENLVFTSDFVVGGSNALTLIPGFNGTWNSDIVVGETYTIYLYAYVYDDDAIVSGLIDLNSTGFNIQELSIGKTVFTWDKM